MNQTDFAAAAGVTRKTLFGYETGERAPDAAALAAWARIGVDITYLITGLPMAANRALGDIKIASDMLQRAGAPPEVGRELLPALVSLLAESRGSLAMDEMDLLSAYRACSDPDRAVIRQMAARLAGSVSDTALKAKKPRKSKETL